MNERISVHNLNVISALKIDLDFEEKLLQEEIDTLKKCAFKKHSESETKLSISTKVIEQYNLKRIGNLFDKYVTYYTEEVLGTNQKFKRTHSWLSLNKNGSAHPEHNHPNSMIACVLYFDEDMTDNELSHLTLKLPGLKSTFVDFKFQLNIQKSNPCNYEIYNFFPKTNRMFIFPAHLNHFSKPSNNFENRYCLGANYFINDMLSENTLQEMNVRI